MDRSDTRYRIQDEPLDGEALIAAVSGPERGAIVTFTGVVRDHHQGRRVVGIEYHAYPAMAERILREIGDDVRRRFEGAHIAIHHRVGSLGVGDASVVIVVAAPHRREALSGCAYAIGRLKSEAPIWKKEHYEGGEAWIEGPGGVMSGC